MAVQGRPDRVRIYLLGGLRVEAAGRNLTRFKRTKSASLLAYLAYHPGRRHQRDDLVELLWPDDPLEAGRANLSSHLWSLRDDLGGLEGGAEIIHTDRTTVAL